MSGAAGQRLHLRLFLEGCEIPVVAAQISSQKNAPATAAIQIPANDYALDFKPRTLVHLFCFDGYQGVPVTEQVWVGGTGIKRRETTDPDAKSMIPDDESGPSPEITKIDLENENYKLIFGGEVVALHYSKNPGNRGMTLQCADWSSYWDIAFQYMVSGMNLGGGGIKAAFTGASTTVFNQFLEGSGDIVLKLLTTAPRTYPKLKGSLLGGLMHLIEAIGGCYFGAKAVKGTNDFFSLAEMRLHLTQMVGANENSSNDEMRLLRANGFGSLFSKTLGGLGKLVTIRQVLLALHRYIFHEIIPITAPLYRPPESDPSYVAPVSVAFTQDPQTMPLVRAATSLRASAYELQDRLEASTGYPEAKAQSNRRGGLKRELTALARVADAAYRKARRVALSTGVATQTGGLALAATAFETVSRQFTDLISSCAVLSAKQNEYRLPLTSTNPSVGMIYTLDSIAAAMQRVLEGSYMKPAKRTSSQPYPPPRLLTQIYRPDVWMVAPPRCNVLFPELYSQFSYGRSYLAETTRLLLRTHEAFYGADILFDGFYMAPSRLLGKRSGDTVALGRMNVAPPDLSDAPAWVLRDMLDHELYTGILPTFERMSDLNLHAIRGGSIEINNVKVGYAQLVCNHIFFGYRFRTRDLQCSGKFNMYAVLGFPMVVIDKYTRDDQLRSDYSSHIADKLAKMSMNLPAEEQQNVVTVSAAMLDRAMDIDRERDPTHFLGTPDMISHSISASQGGTTQYQMGYARTTSEKTEFLGDNLGTSKLAKLDKKVRRKNVVAALKEPQQGAYGILGGKIVEPPKLVTSQYQRAQPRKAQAPNAAQRYASGKLLPLYSPGAGPFTGRKQRATRVPVGVDLPVTAYGAEVVAIVGSGGLDDPTKFTARFEAYLIEEELGSYVTTDVNLPPEHLAFPPWYGEAYRTNRIGALYSQFFRVGAITDPTVVLGAATDRAVGDDPEDRTLYLDMEGIAGAVLGSDALPTPGLSEVPEEPGAIVAPVAPEAEPASGIETALDLQGNLRPVMGEVEGGSPIAEALGELVRIYSAVRTQHYDTPAFVHTYTWRPIASMVDLFGTADLHITDTGEVTTGREGFHSRAFGDVDNAHQLVGSDVTGNPQKVLGLEPETNEVTGDRPDPESRVSARLDTRKEKRTAVLRYLNALANSRGVVLG